MKEQEIKETLSDIRNMMERSQKVLYIDGASGVVAGLWALLGAAVVSFWVYGNFSPLWGAWINPIRHADWASFFIVAGICAVVFCTAFKTVWDMSRQRARRTGMPYSAYERALEHGSRCHAGILRTGYGGHFTYCLQGISHQIYRICRYRSGYYRIGFCSMGNNAMGHRVRSYPYRVGHLVPYKV